MQSAEDNNTLEGRFQTIFNHMNEGILIANNRGEIVMINPKLESLFGYQSSELKGGKIETLIPQRYREKHTQYREGYTAEPVKRGMGKDRVSFARRKDGSEFPVEVSLSYYNTDDGVYVIAFMIDITERFEQQEKIKKFNHELSQLNETLERKVNERTLVLKEALNSLEQSRNELYRALNKEKEVNEMKSRFVSMASHEFRTPLSTILSSVSLISKYDKAEDVEKREKHIVRIKKAVNHMMDILNDFLSIDKLEEGKVRVNIQEHDICAAMEEICAEMEAIMQPGQYITAHHSGPCSFMVDINTFRNILINLTTNAIKFSPENSEIQVDSSIDENGLTVKVKDKGVGISKEDQEYLFDRFYRGKNVTNIQGTGLGLNIVKRYLEMMNGRIECNSELNKGTTFTFFIPTFNDILENQEIGT